MSNFSYNCTVKRSGRNSIALRVMEDNTVIISCPYAFTDEQVEKFLKTKKRWIEQHFAVNKLKNEFLKEVISYEKIMVKGKTVPLTIDEEGENSLTYSEVHVQSLKDLKKLYVKKFGKQFNQMIKLVCAQAKLTCGKVKFKSLKRRWGSCNEKGDLVFNYKLLMLSEEFWLCVITHELCHTVYMDHSKDFYQLVESITPEYKTVRRDLELYSPLMTLY